MNPNDYSEKDMIGSLLGSIIVNEYKIFRWRWI